MRASTGKAVMLNAIPMNKLNDKNFTLQEQIDRKTK
jgi:hypothetical protein